MLTCIIILILAILAVGAYLFVRSKSGANKDSGKELTVPTIIFAENRNVSVKIDSIESFVKDTWQFVGVVISGVSVSGKDENIHLSVKLYKKKADGSPVYFTERGIDATFGKESKTVSTTFRFRSFAEGVRVRVVNAREYAEADAHTENMEGLE